MCMSQLITQKNVDTSPNIAFTHAIFRFHFCVSGTHDDLLAREGQYYKLVQKQIRKKNEVVNVDDMEEGTAGAEADSEVEEEKEMP